MVVAPILKALRAEAARLASVGTDRLALAARKAKNHVTISARFERALLDELRVKAAIAVLMGTSRVDLADSLDGQEFPALGLTIHVDAEQWADVQAGKPPVRDIPAAPFGQFA